MTNPFLKLFKPNPFRDYIKNLIGSRPGILDYYEQAFTHRSMNFSRKNAGSYDNERLEFLGDSILGFVIASWLYEKYPEKKEGELSVLTSKIVKRENMNEMGKKLGLQRFVKTAMTQVSDNVYGNVLEALIGAIYLDKGYKVCRKFILQKLVTESLDLTQLEASIMSYKSHFIEWCQMNKIEYSYKTVSLGSERYPRYGATIFVEKKVFKKMGSSKKRAEEAVSKIAYNYFVAKNDK